MAVSKAQIQATAKYNTKAYDRIEIKVKKGQKAVIQAHAQRKGLSLNAYIVSLIEQDMHERQTGE